VAEFKHPGVFVEEGPAVHTMQGVPTSITAFVGRTWRGSTDEPVRLLNFKDYQRQFGGLWRQSTVGHAVWQFFENGGTDAIIVRVATRTGESAAESATIQLEDGEIFRAANPGSWGLNLKVTIDRQGLSDDKLFDLTVTDDPQSRADSAQRGGTGATERFKAVSVDPASPQFAGTVLRRSQLLRLHSGLRAVAPREQTALAVELSGTDGLPIGTAEVTAPDNRAAKTGLYALDNADLFNLLCIPPYAPGVDLEVANDWAPAAQYCRERRAFLLVDAPSAWMIDDAPKNVQAFGSIARENAALYFPRVIAPDPLNNNVPAAFAPCGMVAGVMARTDNARGVWKAPAGVEAPLVNVTGLSRAVTNAEVDSLTPAGVNCLRIFPTYGPVVWGARTLISPTADAAEWKYVNARRFLIYVEESIYRGTRWALFEPNTPPTWAEVSRQVSVFLQNLWRQGALFGTTAREAFFVQCDRNTMTQDDIDNGRLVILIGMAFLRPAEFMILRIVQHASQPPG